MDGYILYQLETGLVMYQRAEPDGDESGLWFETLGEAQRYLDRLSTDGGNVYTVDKNVADVPTPLLREFYGIAYLDNDGLRQYLGAANRQAKTPLQTLALSLY